MMEVLVNQGKLQGLRRMSRNFTSLEVKVDVQDIQNERLKPLQERAVWQTFLKTVISTQLEQLQRQLFSKFDHRNQRTATPSLKCLPKRHPWQPAPTFSNLFHCHPFPQKYKPPSGAEGFSVEMNGGAWSVTARLLSLKVVNPRHLDGCLAGGVESLSFLKTFQKMAFGVVFLCLRFDWSWSLTKNKVVWGNLAKPWNLAIWKTFGFCFRFWGRKKFKWDRYNGTTSAFSNSSF